MPDQVGEFDPKDPLWNIKILGFRIEEIQKRHDEEKKKYEEKIKELDERIAGMEKTFQRGAGALIVLPIIGTAIGLLFAYGSVIFKPWLSK